MSKFHIPWLYSNILLVSLFVGCDLQVAKDFLSIGGPWEALQSPGKLAALLNLPYCQHPLYTAPLLNNIKPNQYFNSAMIIFRHLEVVAKLAKWKNKGWERKEGEVWEIMALTGGSTTPRNLSQETCLFLISAYLHLQDVPFLLKTASFFPLSFGFTLSSLSDFFPGQNNYIYSGSLQSPSEPRQVGGFTESPVLFPLQAATTHCTAAEQYQLN